MYGCMLVCMLIGLFVHVFGCEIICVFGYLDVGVGRLRNPMEPPNQARYAQSRTSVPGLESRPLWQLTSVRCVGILSHGGREPTMRGTR
jgi:hypothetical protein